MLDYLPFLLLMLVAVSRQSGGFSSPSYVTSYGSGMYESNAVSYVGQTMKIAYDVTDSGLEDYTIAVWQQDLGGGAAYLGPIVNSVTFPTVSEGCSWVVALDGFDLDTSNVFFFWIFQGGSENQGNTIYTQISSAYFNISSADPTSSSSTATTFSTSSTSSKTTASTSTTTTSSTTASSTADSEAIIPKSTGASSDLPSATATSDSSSTSSGSGSSSGGGISTGAGIGIGVGVGLAGICAVICAVIVARGRQKKAKEVAEPVHELPPYSAMRNKTPPPGPYNSGHTDPRAVNHGRPAELFNGRTSEPVELYAGPRHETCRDQ